MSDEPADQLGTGQPPPPPPARPTQYRRKRPLVPVWVVVTGLVALALYLVAWLTLSNLEIAKVVEDLPTGTPAKAVIERMEQRGFTCQRFNAPGFNLQLSISLTPFRYERWSYSIDCDRDEPATSTGWVGTSRVVARMNADGVEAATAETTWRPRSSK